jgi:hypothetical protein
MDEKSANFVVPDAILVVRDRVAACRTAGGGVQLSGAKPEVGACMG